MKRSHVIDGSMKGVRFASLVLLTVVIIQAVALNSVLGDDGTYSLGTDKESYPIGATVTFTGSGYDPGVDPLSPIMYGIDITYVEDDLLVESLEFTPTEDFEIPSGVSWVIPFDAKGGNYIAESYDVSKPEIPLASATFEVLSAVESLEELEKNMTELIPDVEATEISDSLLASLNNAIRKVESAIVLFEADSGSKTAANQLRAARNMLTAFVHKVGAQTGKGIEDEEVAADLIEKAFEYIRYIDSLIGATLEPLGKKLAHNVQNTLHKQEMHMCSFMIRKGLDEAITDEELLSLLNSMEEGLSGALERAKGKMKILEELLASGVLSQEDYDALLMELEKGGNSINLVKAMAELLSQEIDGLEQDRPGLGAHLGQLKKAAKDLEDESEDAGKSHGELTSEAHGKKEGKGHDKDGGGDGSEDHSGSGEGHGGSGEDHGKGNGGDDGGGGEDHGKGGGKKK